MKFPSAQKYLQEFKLVRNLPNLHNSNLPFGSSMQDPEPRGIGLRELAVSTAELDVE